MGTHANNADPAQPDVIMHEDDPVLVTYVSRIFNRQNAARLRVIAEAVFVVFVLLTFAALIKISTTQTSDAICALVNAVPPGNQRIDDTRHKYHCPPFKPYVFTTPIHPEDSAVPSPSATRTNPISLPGVIPPPTPSSVVVTAHDTITATARTTTTAIATVTTQATQVFTTAAPPATTTVTATATSSKGVCGVLPIVC